MKKALLNLDEILEEEGKVVLYVKEDHTIETVTPISFGSNTTLFGEIATLYCLCKMTNNKLIILCSNYLIEREEEKEMLINSVPFHENNTFINNKVLCNMLVSNIPTYLTDFKFCESEDNKIEFKAKLLEENNEENNIVDLTISLDLFASFAYLENYIMDHIFNHHDISLAILSGAKVPETQTTLFNVSDIDILSLVKINKKKNSIGILMRIKSKDEEQYCTLLTPFESSLKINKKKCKGVTMDKIQESYLSNEDEYVSLFMFESRIHNIDKDYMFIRSKNKNGEIKIFTFDTAVRQILENKIIDF